jgi:riboflavin synthase
MFTGIVEEIGEVVELELGSSGGRIVISAAKISKMLEPGGSLAVNGACLTAIEISRDKLAADISGDTIKRTNLGLLKKGNPVNLERALRLIDLLGGHLVLGHIDFVAQVIGLKRVGDYRLIRISVPRKEERYFTDRGSVAVDGVSLTVSGLGDGYFETTLIPFTLSKTTLGIMKVGTKVNIECDIIGKYVARILGREGKGGLSVDYLREQGF